MAANVTDPLLPAAWNRPDTLTLRTIPGHNCGGPMTDLATNVLSYGDNLDILRRYCPGRASTWSTSTRSMPPMPNCWPSRTPELEADDGVVAS
jgi:hypothetical protein